MSSILAALTRKVHRQEKTPIHTDAQRHYGATLTEAEASEEKTITAVDALLLGVQQSLSKVPKSLGKVVIVGLFYGVAIAYYGTRYGWSALDCVYFSTVTVTTVGYGDFHPTDDAGRLFTCFFILFGLLFVFTIINEFASSLINYAQARALEQLDDDPTDNKAPHDAKIALSVFAILFMPFIGAIFFSLNENWTFISALYWSFVTTTTVGYGDLTLTKDSSRIFSIFYIITSVLVVAAAIGNFGLVQMEKAAEEKRNAMLARKLDFDMIKHMDKDGDGVDKLEFLCACLLQMGVVEQKDIDPWLQRFDELDADKSGKLDARDLELFAEEEERKRREKFHIAHQPHHAV